MRILRAILIVGLSVVGYSAAAQERADEALLIRKIELLGGSVERDLKLPNGPVVKVSFKGSSRFHAKYLHLVNGFKSLRDLELGESQVDEQSLKSILSPAVLFNLLINSDEKQFSMYFRALKNLDDSGLPLLLGVLEEAPLPPEIPSADPRREMRARCEVNAALALMQLERADKAWRLMKTSPDPRVRSYLIDRLGHSGVTGRTIIDRFRLESDLGTRRALVLSLGRFDEQAIDKVDRRAFIDQLQELFRSDNDPGMHSAVEWLLVQWNQLDWLKQAKQELSQPDAYKSRLRAIELHAMSADHKPQWYLNGQGQTMIVIPGPVEFSMGSPETEESRQQDERQHASRIGRTFALMTTAVTLDQFRRFDSQHSEGFNDEWVRRGDLPAICVDWYTAVKYCNWLSVREQLEPCYEIRGEEVAIKENYLSLSGYRLPSEAEVEYATRAGAATSRFYGESEDLLARYAWYQKSSQKRIQPVGLLMPNDLGIFDGLGNVFVWCQEKYTDYPRGPVRQDDVEEAATLIKVEGRRVMRGGSILSPASSVRSAYRDDLVPSLRAGYIGFRLARTIPLAERAATDPALR